MKRNKSAEELLRDLKRASGRRGPMPRPAVFKVKTKYDRKRQKSLDSRYGYRA